jgi:ligand-binding SRPBCC domain-containing protein
VIEQVHHLNRRVVIRRPIEEVFAFFSDAGNLERITPPELQFHIVTPKPITIAQGSLLDYRLKLYGLAFRWRTLIAIWEPPFQFVDEQVRGPYRRWIHTHRFVQTPDGTEMTDHVEYQLPLWPIGEVGLPIVRRQVNRIFNYREQVIRNVFD